MMQRKTKPRLNKKNIAETNEKSKLQLDRAHQSGMRVTSKARSPIEHPLALPQSIITLYADCAGLSEAAALVLSA
jgi:hypothetical protein